VIDSRQASQNHRRLFASSQKFASLPEQTAAAFSAPQFSSALCSFLNTHQPGSTLFSASRTRRLLDSYFFVLRALFCTRFIFFRRTLRWRPFFSYSTSNLLRTNLSIPFQPQPLCTIQISPASSLIKMATTAMDYENANGDRFDGQCFFSPCLILLFQSIATPLGHASHRQARSTIIPISITI
jgi:hypothetical protein